MGCICIIGISVFTILVLSGSPAFFCPAVPSPFCAQRFPRLFVLSGSPAENYPSTSCRGCGRGLVLCSSWSYILLQ